MSNIYTKQKQMKRRVNNKNDDSWVDLVQATEGKDDNQKHRGGRITRRSLGMVFGAILMMTFLLSNHMDSRTQSRQFSLHSGTKRRNRKVVLLGPHDRYNDFGDILAERILTQLLVDRAGFVFNATNEKDNTLLLGGIVTRDDMDHHGLTAHKTIYSMKKIQSMSRKDFQYGPYDIVFTGGSGEGPGDEGPSILYEKHTEAVDFLETMALRQSARDDRIYDCPYLFPKELLLPIVNKTLGTNTRKHKTGSITRLPHQKTNYAIIDSLESPIAGHTKAGNLRGALPTANQGLPPLTCRRVANHADKFGYRSSKPFAPDSLVMTREVLGDEIETIFDTEVQQELQQLAPEVFGSSKALRYIAVQHETAKHISTLGYAQDLADALDEVSQKLGNIPVVFFAAGRVGRPLGDHVAFTMSREVSKKMKQPSVLYGTEHALEVAALISKAVAVISTNLHVRILSFVYQKPRATLHGGVNQQSFLDMWEAGDVALMGKVSNVTNVWKDGLERFFTESPNKITETQTEIAVRKVIQYYGRNFNGWSSLLVTPTEQGEDDDTV